MKFILKILLSAIAVIIIEKILPGVSVDTYPTAIWVALILSVLYALLKPVLVLLTLPATILTLGLFLFVINAIIILLAGNLIDGFTVTGFWSALFFSILLSVFESFLYGLIDKK
jgi:putative membrane protein